MLKKTIAVLMVSIMALAAGCGGGDKPATDKKGTAAGGKIELKLGHADNESSIFHKGATAFKTKLEELSGGKMTVKIYPSGQLGNLADMAQAIQMGTVDVAPISSTVLANFSPSIAVYDLPFIVNNYKSAYASLDGDVGKALEKELEGNSMICKGWWTLGYRNVTTSKPVTTIDDLKGQKIRTQNSKIHLELFRALGVDPTPMDFGELFTALQQKTVDGQENPYVNILQTNIFEVNNTIAETEHVFQVAGLLIAPKRWNALTDEQKKWVDQAAKYATEVERKACEEDNEKAKNTLINEKKMKLVKLDKAELQKRTASVYASHPELKQLADKVKSYNK